MGDNPTVEHTSPEMAPIGVLEASPEMLRGLHKLIKHSIHSSGQPTKDQNCLQHENGNVSPGADQTKLSKQSGQNSISAFKPFGISNSPGDQLTGNGGAGQHNHH